MHYFFLIHFSYISTTAVLCLLSACPYRFDMIDDMMIEYQGREEVLLSNLSSLLAPNNHPMQSTDAAVTTKEKENELDPNDSSGSSTSDSSDWSSDDGFSSVDASRVTSDAEVTASASLLATEYALTEKSQVTGDSHDSPKPNFVPVVMSSINAGDDAIDKEGAVMSPSWGGAARDDLDEAIEAGDWRAVSTTGALIAGDITGSDGTNGELLVCGQVEISPLEFPSPTVDLESGKHTGADSVDPSLKKVSELANPFMRDSDLDSESDSSSDGSGSSSSSGSDFSSNENLANDPEGLNFQEEQYALQQQQSQQLKQPEPWQLPPVQEENEQHNLSSSYFSLASENSADKKANILVIRAAVEALVMEGTEVY
jgi:hypothetical protein